MPEQLFQFKFRRVKNPQRVVNVCFMMVLAFSTLLTWREVAVLEEAYAASQRNSLENIATALDRQLQHSIDNLLFYRNVMHYALQTPISTDKSRRALAQFDERRVLPSWQLLLDFNRSIPINGVSDALVSHYPLLARDPDYLHNEISAALEFSYIMQLSDYTMDLQRRTFYTSRAGFYLTSTPTADDPQIISRYERLVKRPYFAEHAWQNNRARGILWNHSWDPRSSDDQVITASVPLDYQQRWYGVLGMDFTMRSMRRFLVEAMHEDREGTVLLYDNRFNIIASSDDALPVSSLFSAAQRAEIASSMEQANQGELRFDSRFVTWARLHNFSGVLIKIHTLQEGVHGEFGRISIVLAMLWLLSTGMLIACWLVVRRLVAGMMNLQSALSWRANYDALTRLLNRGAFFDRAHRISRDCAARGEAFSVIQLDLDHFKNVNDNYGHDAGDKVLAHAAALISQALRGQDIAGRVGGEEFAVLLPGATLADARRIAERIRLRIHNKELLVKPGTTLRLSASFGVSSAQEQGDYDFERLQSLADERLYKAKTGGRNRVVAS
ncbi:cellulose biosynthesis regulator diguanylate cyclase DgcQ [Entomohabitans teleogrylli]|uniref:cellulose biosynthesis regulator diguanylate cyclase DgcQ n=1 Tax=Entomohabitans teleogrylli TaxID=1384589 RepID=UPI00073D34C3|nr:cellulose biosynthesis regulator diguanylate cyclase DgcQ [Entomohabitans teleogrylli]